MKYSASESPIRIECKKAGDQVQVSVMDKGIGIKPDNLDKIFDRYYRVETDHIQHISACG